MAEDRVLLRRRVAYRAFAGLFAGLTLLGAGAVAAAFLFDVGAPPLLVALGAVLLLGAAVLYAWLVRASTEYRIFEDSLEVQSGLLARRIENLQLFRVRDLGLRQSILDRLLRVGDVHLSSTDRSAPEIVLRGIDDPRAVYDALRDLVARSQALRRTMIVEDDGR